MDRMNSQLAPLAGGSGLASIAESSRSGAANHDDGMKGAPESSKRRESTMRAGSDAQANAGRQVEQEGEAAGASQPYVLNRHNDNPAYLIGTQGIAYGLLPGDYGYNGPNQTSGTASMNGGQDDVQGSAHGPLPGEASGANQPTNAGATDPGHGTNSWVTPNLAVWLGRTPDEAAQQGIAVSTIGFNPEMLASMQAVVRNYGRRGAERVALEKVLDYACRWAFTTGYNSKFTVRIGLFPEAGIVTNISIFISFTGTAPHPTRNIYNPLFGVPVQDNSLQGLSRDTKRWMAERILHLMLRCYGDTAFPKSLWFLEDSVGSNPPSLLVPYELGFHVDGESYSSAKYCQRQIIEQTLVQKTFEEYQRKQKHAGAHGSSGAGPSGSS